MLEALKNNKWVGYHCTILAKWSGQSAICFKSTWKQPIFKWKYRDNKALSSHLESTYYTDVRDRTTLLEMQGTWSGDSQLATIGPSRPCGHTRMEGWEGPGALGMFGLGGWLWLILCPWYTPVFPWCRYIILTPIRVSWLSPSPWPCMTRKERNTWALGLFHQRPGSGAPDRLAPPW